MKSIETYKLGVVLEVDGKKGLATIELSDKALQKLGVQAQKSGKSFSGALSDIGANLANIKAGLDIARDAGEFLFGMAKGAADAGAKYHDLNVQTGVYVETLSGLESQLKQSGADLDAFARATVAAQKNLGEAASGSKEMQRAFAALGIRDARAALGDMDATMRTLVKSLGAMQSAGERNAAGSKVMGRGFKELSVFIADTNGNLDEVVERARAAGEVMTDEAAAAADEFGDQLDALSHAASVAARNFGMELVPEITRGMTDMTGALRGNANEWREWGREVADAIRGARQLWDSWLGQAARTTFDLFWNTSPVGWVVNNARFHGAQARERERQAQINDPATAARAVAEIDTAVMLARAKQWMGAPRGSATGDDFFKSGGAKGAATAAENARRKFVETINDWAETFNIPRSALREIGSQSKVHKGWAHKAGMAADISPQFMTPEAIAGARRAGLNVMPKLYTGKGPHGNSTGPHYHIQAMTKAAQAQNKTFDEQENILGSLARKLAEAEMSVRALGRSSTEQELASTRMSLGLQKLEGPAADLAESMMADYEAQLKARDAAQKHAEALDALKGIVASTSAEVFGAVSAQDQMAAALKRAEVPLDSYRGKWAMLLATMKDVGDLTPTLPAIPDMTDIPVGEGPVVKAGPFDAPPPEMKPDRVRQVWKELTSLGDETRRLQFTFQQLAQSLQQQQQVGQKRGFFSKLLGFAAPFLNFIPGVGPILSLGASVASRALAGDYVGAALGAAGGFAPGGAFRGSGPAAAGPYVDPKQFTAEYGAPPPIAGKRALGGPVRRGRAYVVGELKPEVFTPDEDGWIHPSMESYAERQAAGGGYRGRGATGGAIARALNQLHANQQEIATALREFRSMPPGEVVTKAGSAVTETFMRHGARDPKVIEWMQRRTQPQAG